MNIALTRPDCATIAAMAKHIAPKNDIRHYLDGVWIEQASTYRMAVCTNGHALVCAKLGEYAHEQLPAPVFIPRETALAMGKAKAGAIIKAPSDVAEPVTVEIFGGPSYTVPVECRDYSMPDWRRVMPRDPTGIVAQFNHSLLADCYAVACAAYGGKKGPPMFLQHNGDSAALATFDDSCFAIVMPWRQDPVPVPTWFETAPAADDAPIAEAA